MKSFQYMIKDPFGIHVRAAGAIVNEAKKYNSIITLNVQEKSVEATKMISLMGMGVKCGDTVEVDIIGADENTAFTGMKGFFEKFL